MALGQRIQPWPGTGLETQTPRTIGQCDSGAAQDAQTLLLEIVQRIANRSRRDGLQSGGICQISSHFSLHVVCYGGILKVKNDRVASIQWQFDDSRNDPRSKTALS